MRYLTPLFLIGAAGLLWGCSEKNPDSLKSAFKEHFVIGAALNHLQVSEASQPENILISQHFNSITPENLLKWGPVHPEPGIYNFKPADDFVALGQKLNMWMVGHTLVWHQQTPRWVFEDENGNPVNKETLLQTLEDHINTVVGRYKGKIQAWDVVNEALEDDGTLRQTSWLNIIGKEYLIKAFEFARKADPNAKLYYNDYNMWKPAKREGAVRLIKYLQENGVKVDGVGMQGHYGISYPSLDLIEESIIAFSNLGVEVMITEMDIDLLPNPSNRQGADIAMNFDMQDGFNPFTAGLPDSVQNKLSERYAEIFSVFHKHRDKISRVTFWGLTDHNSWLNNWPIRGRTSYPLLFDRNLQPKPAYHAVLKEVAK